MDGSKQDFVTLLFDQLVMRDMNPRKEVKAGSGVADIVTDEAVYEVVANTLAQRNRTHKPV